MLFGIFFFSPYFFISRISFIILETMGIVLFWFCVLRHDWWSVRSKSKKREHAISENDCKVYIMIYSHFLLTLKIVACLIQDVRCINIICILCCYNCLYIVGHCVFCSSSIYGFLLPLWYLQTLLVSAISPRLRDA
jgi:hypothetical protein